MLPGSNPIADGLTFTIQNDPRGVNALGDAGGALGYGDANNNLPPAIQNSVAINFDAYKGFPQGNDGNHSSTGLYIDGDRPNNPPDAQPGDQPVRERPGYLRPVHVRSAKHPFLQDAGGIPLRQRCLLRLLRR